MAKQLLSTFLVLSCLLVRAQDVLSTKLDGSEQGKSLDSFLQELETKRGARFYFVPRWIEGISFHENFAGQTLGEALNTLFLGTDLNYLSMHPDAVVILKDPAQAISRNNAIQLAIRQNRVIHHLKFGEPGVASKGQITVSGEVVDAKTQEPMPGASIQADNQQAGAITDETGHYRLSFNPGIHVLNFSFIDHEDQVIDLEAYDDGVINIEMEEIPIYLDEVIIQDESNRDVAVSRIGQSQLTMRELKRAPPFLGEVDLVKRVQLLPGVTTVGEAATGFNVRGGSVDQNLVLFDGMPVFNSSHVFGFLTAFNPESVRDVSFYRGGIPAEYGGRVSSVLDIRSKDGDNTKWNGNMGIGLITSNLMINGPLKKDKTTVLASFRSTYSDWLVHAIKTNYADLSKSSVRFYDGALKLTHQINNRTKLSVTGYTSNDAFRLVGDTTYRWHNLQLSARLDHEFSKVLNSEFIAGISSYGYSVDNSYPTTASQLSYRITTTMLRSTFIYQRGIHKLNFGWQLMHYQFSPGNLKPASPESNAKEIVLRKQYSIENAFHFSDEWMIGKNLFLEAGARLPLFVSFGPATVNQYKGDIPRDVTSVTDTLNFSKAQPIKAYAGFEPRLSLRWMTSPTASIKLGYNRIYQYLHLVTNTTAVTPVDIWQPSGYYFKPQRADQISLGYFREIKDNKYASSIEGFYKGIKNIVDFKDGAQLILNDHLETELLQGKGKSYGVETSFSKNSGRLTGTLNYTYSRTFRRIAGAFPSESINSGKFYPASFDQPNVLNLSWKYNLSRRIFFTGNFTYHTGRPVTIPLSAFNFEHTTVAYFSGRNQYRIPDYHRLDLALVIEGNHRIHSLGKSTWVISVYNVYARKNPYTVFFRTSGSGIPKPYQLSIVGTVLPSISYNFKF